MTFAQVYTVGATKLSTLFKQRIRWSRNTWRADLRALGQGWVWKHPLLAFQLIDGMIGPFTLTVGLMYFFVLLVYQIWLPAAILLTWYVFSRGIKILPHLLRRPGDIVFLPAYVPANFAAAITRIYGLSTLNHQGWITRRDTPRAPRTGITHLILAQISTLVIIITLAVIVVYSSGVLNF